MSRTTLELHGLQLAVHSWGEADSERPPVLCLPSTGLSGLQWRRLARRLAKRGHWVLAPDFIGYGDSDTWAGPGPFTTRYDVELAAALIRDWDRPGHLVGHSYGGRVGLTLAREQPDRFRSLALFEPTCFGVLRSTGEREAVAELEAYDADGRFLDPSFGASEAWIERFVEYWSGAGSWAELDADERGRWLRSSQKMFEEVSETARDEVPHGAYVDTLGHLPLLTLSGETSTLAGRGCARVLAEVWPAGRHLEIADVGHMGPVLAAAEVSAAILEFIEGC